MWNVVIARRLGLLLMVLGSAAVCAAPRQVRGASTVPLDVISAAEIDRNGMRGTGCAWSLRRGGSIRFVASGDKAWIKSGGGLRTLRPASGAPEAFPFTYDRWIGDDVTLAVVRHGRAIGIGESVIQPAVLRLVVTGRSSVAAGFLDCGS